LDINQIQETEKEDESELSIEASPKIFKGRDLDMSYSYYETNTNNVFGIMNTNNYSNQLNNGSFISINKNNSIFFFILKYLEIIEIAYEKVAQYYLLLANYLNDFQESTLDVLSIYLYTANLDKINFPSYLFYCYLDNINISQLKTLVNRTNNKLVNINSYLN